MSGEGGSRPAYAIQENTFGAFIEFQLLDGAGQPVDISGSTTLSVIVVDPDNVKTTKTAALSSDGTDGRLRYAWASGDLAKPGEWQAQPRAQQSGSYDYYGSVVDFLVSPNL